MRRNFRDININISSHSIPSDIFTFCFNPRYHHLRSIGECIFYVQLIGEMGIPIAESTQIINLGQLKDIIAVSLHESIYLLGKSRKSYQLSFSVHQYLSLQELDLLFLAEKWNVEERLLRPAIIFPSVPSKRSNLTSNDSCFVTVQDVNLSEVSLYSLLLYFLC